MHELGVVFHVIKKVEEVAAENAVTEVTAVTISLGEVTGVIPEYLVDCWNWARKKSSVLTGAQLKVEPIPAVTFCEDCRSEYETVKHGKICPHCGSEKTYLLQGNEFLIKEIEVPEEPGQNSEN